MSESTLLTRKWFRENRLLFAFLAVSFTSGTAGGIMQLLLPLYALSLDIGDAGIGLIRAVGTLGGLVTTVPGGFLIDRFGSRKVYLVCGVLDVVLLLLVPFTATRSQLVVCLLLGGGVATLRWTALNSAFIERLAFFGNVKAGWMRASMAVGFSFLGPLLGGQLVPYTSWPAAFGIMTAFILVPLFFIPGFRTGETAVHVPRYDPDERSLFFQFRQLARNRLLLRTGILQGLAMACNHTFLVFIIILLVKNLHHSPRLASIVVGAQGIGAVLVMLWGGDLADRFCMQRVHVACFLMQTVGLVTAGFFSNVWVVSTGAVILAAGAGLLMATSYSQMGKVEGRKGKVAGFFFLITGTGVTLGPLYGGYLAEFFGTRAAFTGFLPLMALALAYLAITWQAQRKQCAEESNPGAAELSAQETVLQD